MVFVFFFLSFMEVIEFVKKGVFDVYVVVGGGFIMDICKVVNLYAFSFYFDFLDYVNVFIGKGKFVFVFFKFLIVGKDCLFVLFCNW